MPLKFDRIAIEKRTSSPALPKSGRYLGFVCIRTSCSLNLQQPVIPAKGKQARQQRRKEKKKGKRKLEKRTLTPPHPAYSPSKSDPKSGSHKAKKSRRKATYRDRGPEFPPETVREPS
jgi:hypothetical protein